MRSYRINELNRLFISLTMICLSVVLIGLFGAARVYAAGSGDAISVKVPYSLTYDAEKNRTNDTFDYRIEALDGAPMPEGSKRVATFSIDAKPGSTVSGTLDLKIVFPAPGEYDY